MNKRIQIAIDEEAYDILNEYRDHGKSFSGAVKSLAESVCGKADEEGDTKEEPEEK